jgi:hypothetical protein
MALISTALLGTGCTLGSEKPRDTATDTGSADTATDTGDTDTGSADTADTGDTGEPVDTTLSFSTTIAFLDESPGEGITVCEAATKNCTVLDAHGAGTLEGFEVGTEFWLTFDAATDNFPAIQGFSADEDIHWSGVQVRASTRDGMFAFLGAQFDPELGLVAFGTGQANVQALLAPSVGDGPYYVIGETVSDTFNETDESGYGFFVNVPPGDYTVSFTSLDGDSCTAQSMTAEDASGANKVVAVSGYMSVASARCE